MCHLLTAYRIACSRDHVSAVTFRAFNHVYSDTGLFGVYYAGPGLQIDDAQHEVSLPSSTPLSSRRVVPV
jgi:hypothetical protein